MEDFGSMTQLVINILYTYTCICMMQDLQNDSIVINITEKVVEPIYEKLVVGSRVIYSLQYICEIIANLPKWFHCVPCMSVIGGYYMYMFNDCHVVS